MASGERFQVGDLRDCQAPYALIQSARPESGIQDNDGSWFMFGHEQASQVLRSSSARSGFIGA